MKNKLHNVLIVFFVFWILATIVCLSIAIMDSRSEMIADMQKNPEKYMTQEQIMFIRINDINKKLDVLIKESGADKKCESLQVFEKSLK